MLSQAPLAVGAVAVLLPLGLSRQQVMFEDATCVCVCVNNFC